MDYDIYILDESDLTIVGGVLDGVSQGDGSHLNGATITLNSGAWRAISISDNDGNFQDSDNSQVLDGAQTIDGTSYADGTVVEAEYGLELSDGTNTWTVVGFNVNNSSPAYATVEGLAFVGGPGGFPPVGVPLTVTNTFEGPNFTASNYATPICFASGTRIATPNGLRRVEEIEVGDLVLTDTHGPQPVRWRAAREMPAIGKLAPIVFLAGAIGNTRALRVSPQHRMQVSDWRAQLWFGEDAILVPAKDLVNGETILRHEGGMVCYHHLLFDQHEIIFAENVATESFHPGIASLSSLEHDIREELLAIFPELAEDPDAYGPSALPDVRGRQAARLLVA
ncbi:MAG: Hint domain-containing protein [Pseudomonadota bacterium]